MNPPHTNTPASPHRTKNTDTENVPRTSHFVHTLRNIVCFRGRSTRAAFWEFVGITQLLMVLLLLPAFYTLVQFWVYVNQQQEYLDFAVGLLTEPLRVLPTAVDDMHDMVSRMASCYFAEPWETCPAAMWSLIAAAVWAVCIALPTLAILVRRLRDAGASLWWALPPVMSCIPVSPVGQIGLLLSIITLIECCRDSRLPQAGQGLPHA